MLSVLYRPFIRSGSAWLVTFPKGHDHELFEANPTAMEGTSPFALVEEVGERAPVQKGKFRVEQTMCLRLDFSVVYEMDATR